MPTSDQQFCYLQLHLQRLPRLIHSVGWELLVKADSVVSSIMPRVPNSPHRGNLSLISPACLAAFTGQVERSAISEVTSLRISRAGGRRNHLAKEMPFCTKAWILLPHQGPGVQHLWGNADVCVRGFSVLQISMKDNKTVSQYFQITALQLPCLWPEHFIKGYSLCLKSFSSSYDPLFLSWLRALEIRMIQRSLHEIPKALLSVIL